MTDHNYKDEFDVLLADDNDSYREVMKIFLEDAGYTVAEARTAQQAEKVLEYFEIDTAVIDRNFEGEEEGYNLLEETIAQEHPDTPTCVCSAYSPRENELDPMFSPRLQLADAYLTKPVTNEVVDTVNYLKAKSDHYEELNQAREEAEQASRQKSELGLNHVEIPEIPEELKEMEEELQNKEKVFVNIFQGPELNNHHNTPVSAD